MKKTKSTLALIAALTLGSVASASAAEPLGAEVSCHGQIATYVGTPGDDVLSDAEQDFGRNPVFVLDDGNDQLLLGEGYQESLDSLTVCGGAGEDTIQINDYIGNHAEVLLDGGLDDDVVGNDAGLEYSDLARMTLVGGDGDDVLRAANGNDTLNAGRGDDSAYGLGGKDEMVGGTGNDALHGQRGSDRLLGGSGYDYLDGDMHGYPDGHDVADGGANRDRCEAEVKHSCES